MVIVCFAMSKKKHHFKKPSEILKEILSDVPESGISIKEVEARCGKLGFYFFIFLFSLIITFPIPIPPGFHFIFEVPVFMFAIQMLFKKQQPWLPKFIANKKLSPKICNTILSMSEKYLPRFEKHIKNRFSMLVQDKYNTVSMLVILACTIAVIVPLPLTNWIPSIAITIISLGYLCSDGLIILIGYVVALIGIGIATLSTVIFFGVFKFAIYHFTK